MSAGDVPVHRGRTGSRTSVCHRRPHVLAMSVSWKQTTRAMHNARKASTHATRCGMAAVAAMPAPHKLRLSACPACGALHSQNTLCELRCIELPVHRSFPGTPGACMHTSGTLAQLLTERLRGIVCCPLSAYSSSARFCGAQEISHRENRKK